MTDVKPSALGLAWLLTRWANNRTGMVFKRQEQLAEEFGCDIRTIRRHIKELERVGALKIHAHRNNQGETYNDYQLLMPADRTELSGGENSHRTELSGGVENERLDAEPTGQNCPSHRTELSVPPDKNVRHNYESNYEYNCEEKSPHASRADATPHQLTPMQKACDRVAKATHGAIQYAQAKKIFEGIQEDFATPEQMADAAIALQRAGEPVSRGTIIKAIDPTVGMGDWNAPVWDSKDDPDILEEAPEPEPATVVEPVLVDWHATQINKLRSCGISLSEANKLIRQSKTDGKTETEIQAVVDEILSTSQLEPSSEAV